MQLQRRPCSQRAAPVRTHAAAARWAWSATRAGPQTASRCERCRRLRPTPAAVHHGVSCQVNARSCTSRWATSLTQRPATDPCRLHCPTDALKTLSSTMKASCRPDSPGWRHARCPPGCRTAAAVRTCCRRACCRPCCPWSPSGGSSCPERRGHCQTMTPASTLVRNKLEASDHLDVMCGRIMGFGSARDLAK